jgi:hypothetical protein
MLYLINVFKQKINYLSILDAVGISAPAGKIRQFYTFSTMLSGSTVTTAWRVLGLRIEETASRYGG